MNEISLPVKRPYNWKVLLFIVVLLIPATYAVIPYTLTLSQTAVELVGLPLLLVLNLINVAFYAGLAAIGLFLATRIGLGLPFVEGWLKKEPMWDKFKGILLVGIDEY